MVGEIELHLKFMKSRCSSTGVFEMAHDTATGGDRVSDESLSQDGIVNSKLYRVCETPGTRDTQIFETLMSAALSRTTR